MCPGVGDGHKHACCQEISFTPPPALARPGDEVSDKIPIGIYATPEEFVQRARALQHPMAGPSVVTDSFKRALFANLTKTPAEVASLRASFLEHVTHLTEKLRPDEEALHRSFSPELQKVLKGKRLLLFKTLLEEYRYDDVGVWEMLRDGPSLTGTQDHPPYADRSFRPATVSTEQLERESSWRRKFVSFKTSSPQDAATLTSLGEGEVSAGFISGPYRTAAEVTEALGRPDWIATPRFVLLQGSKAKPRVIDDCKSSGLNSSFSSTERLRLQDLDYVVAMIKLAGKMSGRHKIRMDLSTGDVLCGDRVLPSGSEWLGRCVDLAKAYKQMAVPRSQRHLVVLCHHDEQGLPLYYISESLPFGAEGSVYGFVRMSRALSFLMNEAILVPSSVYFDDFPAISPKASSASATAAIKFLLSALGWRFSTDPDKARDFDSTFDVLGCTLDLSGLAGPFGFLEVRNKPRRIEHITELLDELGSGRGDFRLVPVVQGQLNFASNFVLGRAVAPLSRALSSSSSGEMKSLCERIRDLLRGARPRRVSWHSPDAPILIFTDAAFEKGLATVGAVVIDTMGGPASIYDGVLPSSLVSSWQRYDDEQIICQAELAAAVCIRHRERYRLTGRKCIYFIDNESARFALIRAVSGVPSMQSLASSFHTWDLDHPHYPWIERVPSTSNPADLPSRGRINDCIRLLDGRHAGSLCMPPELENFDPMGDFKPLRDDGPTSILAIAAAKD
ncbi:unnamed protein product [Symbiodinium sp. CCMP2592]|nr:unnamed protein product [Symbiodinium sp. CCMP2592]